MFFNFYNMRPRQVLWGIIDWLRLGIKLCLCNSTYSDHLVVDGLRKLSWSWFEFRLLGRCRNRGCFDSLAEWSQIRDFPLFSWTVNVLEDALDKAFFNGTVLKQSLTQLFMLDGKVTYGSLYQPWNKMPILITKASITTYVLQKFRKMWIKLNS